MGAEAKKYLQDHSIPQLFEGLMTGLIYNKPENPINFLESAINQIRVNPDLALKWDSFVDFKPEPLQASSSTAVDKSVTDRQEKGDKTSKGTKKSPSRKTKARVDNSSSPRPGRSTETSQSKKNISQSSKSPKSRQSPHQNGYNKMLKKTSSVTSVAKASEAARIPPNAPIILFIGGPGGGKTRYAAKVREMLEDQGLVHICMPDLIRQAIAKYKDRFSEWRDASERYQRGELIPNNLAQDLVKAEMGRHPSAKAYFLEGFPREARQVEDFERNVRPVNMAMILDYDEETLRRHMENRGLLKEVIDRRISEFKQKTLPSAKYFDDQRLLHLIPGEKDDSIIFERMKKLVGRAIEAGVSSNEPIPITPLLSGAQSPEVDQQEAGSAMRSSDGANPSESQSSPIAMSLAGDESKPNTSHTQPPPPATPPVINGVKHQSPVASSPLNSSNKRPETSGQTTGTSMQARRPSTQSLTNKPTDVVEQQRKEGGSVVGTSKSKRVEELATKSRSGSATSQVSLKSRPESKISGKIQARSDVSKQMFLSKSQSPTTSKNKEKVEASVAEEAIPAPAVVSPNTVSPANPADRFPLGLPSNAPVILIIGAPGSEKSQFAQRISKKYDGFIHISMGDLFRRKLLQNNEDELWIRIGKKMDMGEVIPMKICRELLYTNLHEIGARSWGYVIEGYPRTLPQVEDIEAQLGRLDLAILIDCTEQYCKDTLKKRYLAAKEEGAERSDDEESIVKIRLGLFKQNTLPMLKYLDDKGKLRVVRLESRTDSHKIEGDEGVDKVFQEITNAIDNAVFIDDGGSGKSLNSSKQASVVDSPLK